MAIRMVNPVHSRPQQLGVAASERVDIHGEMERLQALVQHCNHPEGSTPSIIHLKQIVNCILAVPTDLLEEKAVAIVLVTDHLPRDAQGREGEPINNDFIQTLKQLDGLSVWVVIRLSTDEQRVVDFYTELDNSMAYLSVNDDEAAAGGGEVHLDVLDDYVSEAAQVQTYNPWLNYGYPLHLCRESAVNFPAFDVLNDRPLLHDELCDFIALLFDRRLQAWSDQPLPNPRTHYREFRKEVQDLVQRNPSLYNPIKKKIVPWIDMRQLDRLYSTSADPEAVPEGSCCNIL